MHFNKVYCRRTATYIYKCWRIRLAGDDVTAKRG